MTRPFDGVRVLDFTHVVSGPFGSYQLALQGADVIKIEQRGGEEMRFGSLTPDWGKQGYSPGWAALNGNKRSLTLDLKQPRAIEIVKRLAATADVVMENFRPGVMDKLGIGHATLSEINPALIYCAVTGFGQEGPEAQTASFDGMIQAISGMMSMTGDPATGPVRTGFAAADTITGITAAYAISCALFQRTRTGRGQFVDVAMLDASMSLMAQQLTECLIGGHIQRQFGNLSVSRKPTANMFPTQDGNMILAVINEKQYRRLMTTLRLTDVFDDPRFETWTLRIANGQVLRERIAQAMRERSTDEWVERFKAADIPCGRVLNVREALDNPQLKHRAVIQHIDGPLGAMSLIGPGFKLADGTGAVVRPPPLPGQHVDELLQEMGYTHAQIEQLRSDDVV
ncbi:CaiB/BaiF CoA-transferase family protein [Bordetella sp. BOR01]|uniref:CaiB/BaiF CoA transferase family protein n=1 Tax=Bordetella sp. BOR01 TaxID=2854779 RepID=UPI001C486EF7|nr:CoA transferase [Bordetella sp. BOR01]MBV7486543.1 CoA transferase [Bordetella sp. BOR01]